MPEPERFSGDLPPPELRVGPLIEIWADGEGEYGPHFPAMRRHRAAREAWCAAQNLTTAESCRLIPRGAPWSFEFLVTEGRRAEAERRLAEAGVTVGDIPALREAAQNYPE